MQHRQIDFARHADAGNGEPTPLGTLGAIIIDRENAKKSPLTSWSETNSSDQRSVGSEALLQPPRFRNQAGSSAEKRATARTTRERPDTLTKLYSLSRSRTLHGRGVIHSCIVEHGMGEQPLQLGLLALERLHPLGFRHAHPSELTLPIIKKRLRGKDLSYSPQARAPSKRRLPALS